MAAYSIWIVSPPGYIHSRCFEEVAVSLHEAFLALGHTSRIVTDPARIEGRGIVLGCNLLPHLKMLPPPGTILYNLEQVSDESAWLSGDYLNLLKSSVVWDYSARNIAGFRSRGVNAILCGIGYMPGLTRMQPAPAQDIDVIFVGSLNERRKAIIEQLRQRGVRAGVASGVYGRERDALFMRSRIVLNLHYYEAQVLEIVRISYLLANRICVVSETGRDRDLEEPLKGGIAFADYNQLVNVCTRLLADESARKQIAETGFRIFSGMSQTQMLKSALEQTPD